MSFLSEEAEVRLALPPPHFCKKLPPQKCTREAGQFHLQKDWNVSETRSSWAACAEPGDLLPPCLWQSNLPGPNWGGWASYNSGCWAKLNKALLLKGFWWHNHLLNAHPCIEPQLLDLQSKVAPFWANYRSRAVPSSGLAQARAAKA